MTSSDPHNPARASSAPPPVERDFDMRIAADGRWYHEGGLIRRDGLVRLFASVLCVDADGQHWLRTPVEFGRIEVEDAPFIITGLGSEGTGRDRLVTLTDNLDRAHLLGPDRRLFFGAGSHNTDTRPYVRLEGGLTARLSRPVWYELAGLADDEDDTGTAGIWSAGCFFALS